MPINALRDLRQQIAQHYDLDELKLLAFDLSVDWDELAGTGKSAKVQELIVYLGQHGRLQELIHLLREERPSMTWPEVDVTGVESNKELSSSLSVRLFLMDREASYGKKIVFVRNPGESRLNRQFGVALLNNENTPLKHIRMHLDFGWGGGDQLSQAPEFNPPQGTAWKALVNKLYSERVATLVFDNRDSVSIPNQSEEWRGFTLFHNEPNWKGQFRVYCTVSSVEPFTQTKDELVIEVT